MLVFLTCMQSIEQSPPSPVSVIITSSGTFVQVCLPTGVVSG